MGRKRKNRQQKQHPHQQESRNSKRRRGGRGRGSYWIQDCPDLLPFSSNQDEEEPADGHKVSLLLWISAAHLKDGHPSPQLQYSTKKPKQKSADADDDHEEQQGASDSTNMASNNHQEGACRGSNEPSPPPPPSPDVEGSVVVAAEPASGRPFGAFLVGSIEETTTMQTSAHESESQREVVEGASSEVQRTEAGPSHPAIYIQREPTPPSQRTITRQRYNNQNHFRNLPHGDCGDGVLNPYDPSVVQDKYWAQRHRLFSKFDDGVQLDTDGWFSVTPEAIARHIARRLTTFRNSASGKKKTNLVVLDAFCGVGGNTIALAQQPGTSLILAVDTCLDRLRLAANNCRVYNISPSKVLFVHGDACDVLNQYTHGRHVVVNVETIQGKLIANANGDTITANSVGDSVALTSVESTDDKASTSANNHGYTIVSGTSNTAHCTQLPSHLDAIFLSPPWGGSDYEQIGPRHYMLDCIRLERSGVDGVQLLRQSLAALPPDELNLAYFLPRNLNGLTFAQQCYDCGVRGCVELEQNILNQKLKTITVYIDSNSSNINNHNSSRRDAMAEREIQDDDAQ